MTARAAALAFILLAFGPRSLDAQEPATSPPDVTQRFPVGETQVYQAKFGLISLGGGIMHVAGVDTVRGVPSLHVVFRLKGGNFLYRLDDRMDSWIGLHDFASRRFVQDFEEGGSKRYAAYEIFPDSGFYRSSAADTAAPTSPAPLDDAAFFYFVRTLDLEVGQRLELERYFRPDRNPVVLVVLGRDTVDVPAGRFTTLVLKPTIKGRGILSESQDPRIWISDDERRLIVQIKSKFASIATITLSLKALTDAPPAEYAEEQ